MDFGHNALIFLKNFFTIHDIYFLSFDLIWLKIFQCKILCTSILRFLFYQWLFKQFLFVDLRQKNNKNYNFRTKFERIY